MYNRNNLSAVEQAVSLLVTAGYDLPNGDDRAFVRIWENALSHLSDSEVLMAAKLWLLYGTPFFPKPSQMLSILREHTQQTLLPEEHWAKIKKMILSLPAYVGSDLSRRQRDEAWRLAMSREYPNGLPESVERTMKAIGGKSAIGRAFQGEGGFSSNKMEKSFKQTMGTIQKQVEKTNRLAIAGRSMRQLTDRRRG